MMSKPDAPDEGHLGRILMQLQDAVVDELQIEVLVEQHHAVVHVVEHGLHDAAGALDVLLAVLQVVMSRNKPSRPALICLYLNST